MIIEKQCNGMQVCKQSSANSSYIYVTVMFKLLSAMLAIAIGEITLSPYIWYETEHVQV